MGEQRPRRHPREPAAGGEEGGRAPVDERPGRAEEAVGSMTDDPAALEHPTKPAAGREEGAQSAERAGGDD
jgi:hypothetical protein